MPIGLSPYFTIDSNVITQLTYLIANIEWRNSINSLISRGRKSRCSTSEELKSRSVAYSIEIGINNIFLRASNPTINREATVRELLRRTFYRQHLMHIATEEKYNTVMVGLHGLIR